MKSAISAMFIISILHIHTTLTEPHFPDPPVLSSDSISGAVKGGSEVHLYCNSVSDSPVRWVHNNLTVEDSATRRYSISEDTTTLTIDSFQNSLDHAGIYQCVRDGLISNPIELNKARIKAFGRGLEDVPIDVVVGNTAVLPCNPPSSRPEAQTVFEFGGDTIDESHGRYLLLYNVSKQKHYLQIQSVGLSDAGTYRCVAINSITGKKVSSPNVVKLTVSEGLTPTGPKLVDFPEKDKRVIAVEGDTIVLPCVHTGYPVPTVTWEKYMYQGSLPVNRSQQVFDNLVISDIHRSDAGTYQCLGENSATNTVSTEVFVLEVYSKPVIGGDGPKDITSVINGSISFKCPVRDTGYPEHKAEWYFNGTRVLSDGLNVFIQETPDSDLIIRKATANHTGVYQCIVSNEAGSDQMYIRASIQTPEYLLPSEQPLTTTASASTEPGQLLRPSAPTVEQTRPTGFRLNWTMDSVADVFSYRIKVKAGSADWTIMVYDIPRQATFYEINGLTVGTKYRFIVVAVYRGFQAAESEPSRRIKLSADFVSDYEPPTPPSTMSTTTRVSQGDDTQSNATNQPLTTSTPALPTPLPASAASNTVSALSPDQSTSPAATDVLPCDGPSSFCRPPKIILPPTNQTGQAGLTYSSACVSASSDDRFMWFKDGHMITTDYTKYEIALRGTSMSILNAQASDSGWYTCEVSNQAGTAYESAYIHIIDNNRPDWQPKPSTAAASVTTTPTTSPLLVPDIDRSVIATEMVEPPIPDVRILSSTEVMIEWEPISEGIAVDFYKIQYREMSRRNDGSRPAWDTMDGKIQNENTFKVVGLRAGTSYKFRLAAVYINKQHRLSPSTRKIRLPNGVTQEAEVVNEPPTHVPRLSLAKQTGLTELTLRWYYYGDNADRFIVQYRREADDASDWTEFAVAIDNADDMREMQAAITQLRGGEFYQLRVFAENSFGRTRPSNTLRRQLEDAPAPAVIPLLAGGGNSKLEVNNSNADEKYVNSGVSKTSLLDNDMLYIILGAALGSMVLLLIILVAVCGCKQRQQRRAMAALRVNPDKFADASKVLHMNSHNGSSQQQRLMYNGSGPVVAAHHQPNGTLSSLHSQNKEPRMSLNINPLDEMQQVYDDSTLPAAADSMMAADYNLMQHYPHYNSSIQSASRQGHPHPHQSQSSLASHSEGFGGYQAPYSHASLPHQGQPLRHGSSSYVSSQRATPTQFTTFLPDGNSSSQAGGKLPHPHVLRPSAFRAQSPMSNRSAEIPHSSSNQRRRRKKRSSPRSDNHNFNFSSNNGAATGGGVGSGREYLTTPDLSSADEGAAMLDGDGHYGCALPPPPVLPGYNHITIRNTDDDM